MFNGRYGMSGARLRKTMRDARPPAPVEPVTLDIAAGSPAGVSIAVLGMNITPSTNMLLVPDAAPANATAATVSQVLVPSTQDGIGSITTTWDFTNIPPGTPALFRIYLTGPWGQRIFAGTIGSL